MKTTNPALCATPLAKCTDARGVWESQPLLAYAYGDYRAFEENYNVAKDGADARALGLLRDRFDCEVSALHAARARLALATRPLSNANGAPFPVAQRMGKRLVLWLYGPVTSQAAPIVDAIREHHDALAILLRVDSAGGCVEEGFRLAGAISNHRARSLAIVDRSCWSAAVLPAVACDRVYIRSDATMMVHPSSRAAAGNVSQLLEAARTCRQTDMRIARFIGSRRRRIGNGLLNSLLGGESFMSAADAVEFGFADAITHSLIA